jgi:hypothetical protein
VRRNPHLGYSATHMELVILIILVVLVLAFLGGRGMGSLSTLVVNALVGIVLLFLTNLVLSPPIPINIITVLICAIGGVLGWLIILILHILGIAFYVAV